MKRKPVISETDFTVQRWKFDPTGIRIQKSSGCFLMPAMDFSEEKSPCSSFNIYFLFGERGFMIYMIRIIKPNSLFPGNDAHSWIWKYVSVFWKQHSGNWIYIHIIGDGHIATKKYIQIIINDLSGAGKSIFTSNMAIPTAASVYLWYEMSIQKPENISVTSKILIPQIRCPFEGYMNPATYRKHNFPFVR